MHPPSHKIMSLYNIIGVNRQSVSASHPHICKCIQCLHIHKGHRYLTFSWERQRNGTITHKTMKQVKPSLKANPDRSLIGGINLFENNNTHLFSWRWEINNGTLCWRWMKLLGGWWQMNSYWPVERSDGRQCLAQCGLIQLVINCSHRACCTLCRKWEWLIVNKSTWAGNDVSPS